MSFTANARRRPFRRIKVHTKWGEQKEREGTHDASKQVLIALTSPLVYCDVSETLYAHNFFSQVTFMT